MSKLVIELQKDIIENKTDTISILRKAKLIATKLNLIDFTSFTICPRCYFCIASKCSKRIPSDLI